MSGAIARGDRAPDFTLPGVDGPVSLASLLAKGPVVLYFYPKDGTPGCTVEACSFRDAYESFVDIGATVVGVSEDSVESHRRFVSRYALPFLLLADAGGRVAQSYGVRKTLGLLAGRVTFVIGPDGVVLHAFESQLRPGRHVVEALETLRALAAGTRAARA